MTEKAKKQLGYWLMVALAIVYLQVIIGGTTRLTESGLSMTDWKIVTGVLPPLNQADWQTEFEKYQAFPQYKELNQSMSLPEFQKIYFWEWLHRVWGRWGFMFLLGVFALFLATKKLNKRYIYLFLILLFLYICQGVLGWIMVKSGLVDVPRVSHYRLTAHLVLALSLFAYILWMIVGLFVRTEDKIYNASLRTWSIGLTILTSFQIVLGGFMSGLRAAKCCPTFPDINGAFIPPNWLAMEPWYLNFLENTATIQFVHRMTAYLLLCLVFVFWAKARKVNAPKSFKIPMNALPIIVCLQALLGILTLLYTTDNIPVTLGVMHQAGGLLLISTFLLLDFQFTKKPIQQEI